MIKKKSNKKACVIFRLLSLGFIFLFVHTSNATGQTIGDDTLQIRKWVQDAGDSFERYPQRAVVIVQKVIDLSEKIDYQPGVARAFMAMGRIYEKIDQGKSIEYLQKALSVSEQYHIQDIEWKTLSILGVLSAEKSDYNIAFSYFTKGLSITKERNDTSGMAVCYLYIGNCFSDQGNYAEAITNYEKAAAFYRSLNRPHDFAYLYNNIGILYTRQKKYKQGINYLRTSIHFFAEAGDTVSICSSFSALGECFSGEKRYDSAIYYTTKSLAIAKATGAGDTVHETTALYNLGSIYDTMGRYADAEKYYREALSLSREISFKENYYKIPRDLAGLYAKMKNYKDAYQYLDVAYINRDSFLNMEKVKAMAEMQARYNIKELDDKNKLLQKENDIKQVRLQRKNIIQYSGFGAALLFLVIAIQMVRQNRLKATKEKLELEQKQLLAQMNPHFIFNCLNSIQHLVINNDKENANRYLADFALLMRQTLDNSKDAIISLARELEYLENYLSFEYMRFNDKFTYSIQCAPEINTETTEIPSMIIQPFVENAIRHGLCNLETRMGQLNIRFYKKDGFLFCEVDDNGIGMEKAKKLKEQAYLKYQSHGMELTRKRLALVSKMRSDDYKIVIVNKTEESHGAEGTTIIIQFPLQS